MFRLLPAFVFVIASGLLLAGEDPPLARPEGLAERRMLMMASRIEAIAVSSPEEGFPKRLQTPALFRYDDEARGYVDGTVWRLGEKGRPLAIITAELHPNYLGSGPRIVYDFLSLTERPFSARSHDVANWTPGGSAVRMAALPDGPEPAAEPAKRLTQIKSLARRFSGTQLIQETDETSVELRLLPKHIDRYVPHPHERADGAVFLLVNGRNPALVLLVETDGDKWQYGVGRLSLPSTLTLRLDGRKVWSEGRAAISLNSPYHASNSAVVVPQPEVKP
jgi:hypothetical protein